MCHDPIARPLCMTIPLLLNPLLLNAWHGKVRTRSRFSHRNANIEGGAQELTLFFR